MSELPSNCRIENAVLTTYDGSETRSLLAIITESSITQSIDSGFYSGYVKILDNIGILENLPIRGEERLSLTIVATDLGTRKELDLQVYKVDNVSISKANDGVTYYLHFVSRVSFQAAKRRIIQSFGDRFVDEIATEVFSTYFEKTQLDESIDDEDAFHYKISKTNRYFISQPCQNALRCVIPNYIPTQAMDFLASRAFIKDKTYSSCAFHFFETLDDYYFTSYEYLIKKSNTENNIIPLKFYAVTSKDPKDSEQQVVNVERIDIPKRVSVTDDIYGGGYTNKPIEVDLMRKVVRNLKDGESNYFKYQRDADFIDMDGRKGISKSFIHTDQFMEDTFNEENARRFLVYRDYSSIDDIVRQLPPEMFLGDIISNRVSYEYHLNSTSIIASLKGRLDIKPGNVVDLDMLEQNAADTRGSNKQLSGKYLVHSTNHNVVDDIMNTSLKLLKFDWSI